MEQEAFCFSLIIILLCSLLIFVSLRMSLSYDVNGWSVIQEFLVILAISLLNFY